MVSYNFNTKRAFFKRTCKSGEEKEGRALPFQLNHLHRSCISAWERKGKLEIIYPIYVYCINHGTELPDILCYLHPSLSLVSAKPYCSYLKAFIFRCIFGEGGTHTSFGSAGDSRIRGSWGSVLIEMEVGSKKKKVSSEFSGFHKFLRTSSNCPVLGSASLIKDFSSQAVKDCWEATALT